MACHMSRVQAAPSETCGIPSTTAKSLHGHIAYLGSTSTPVYIDCMQCDCIHILPHVSKFNFTNLYTVNLCNCVHAFLLHIHAFMCVMKLHMFMQVLLISQCLSFQHIEMENT